MVRSFVLVIVLLSATRAEAIPRSSCPGGTEWNVAAGACMKKRAAPRLSAQDKFNKANDHIDGRGKDPDPKKGVALLEESCGKDNHAQSCTLLGFLYARGRAPVGVDAAKASQYYTKACTLKDIDGCILDADFAFRIGKYETARTSFDKACTAKSGFACARYADILDRGIGGPQDEKAALALFKKSMQQLTPLCPTTGWADGNACYMVGFMYENGKGTDADAAKALAAYRAGCSAGGGDACNSLGNSLTKGVGGDADVDGAKVAYERACTEFDQADACETLATQLTDTKTDLPRAKKIAERACELDPKVCGALGRLLAYVLPEAQRDEVAATKAYRKACESGGLGWCNAYAERAFKGKGMAKDLASATDGLERACMGAYADPCALIADYLADTDGPRAMRLATRGCDVYKHGFSCYRVGWLAVQGKGGDKDPLKAFVAYGKACDYGSPAGCDVLGDAHFAGTGTEKDLKKAYEAWGRGCKGFNSKYDADACQSLAKAEYFGNGVPKNIKNALEAFAKACQGGAQGACTNLVVVYNETDKATDVKDSLDKACKANNEDACLAVAELQYASEKETDRRAAYQAFTAACERKVAAACLRQAGLLMEGRGTTKDLPAAEKIFRVYCEAGDNNACWGLGRLLHDDPKQQEEAQRQLARACELEHSFACNAVGYRLYAGKGVAWNVIEAAKYYKKSCDQGAAIGCSNLAYSLMWGVGIKQDHKQAFELFDKACKPPEFNGCAPLGNYLMTGLGGIKVDKKRAETVLRSSCRPDDAAPEGCRDLALLVEENKGSPAEAARLRTLALTRTEKLAADYPYYHYVWGSFYDQGIATVKDPQKALEHFAKSCDGYDPIGCLAAGKALKVSKKKEDQERMRFYFERACAAGLDEGCTAKTQGPSPVPGGKGCCGGEVAPGAEA
ncbi:MAG: sel1 repeat family protein, partial [Deltaproteobacteria bacterium]|nr:sel1 repeat family protein [Deltaproteobacteria bacterium]